MICGVQFTWQPPPKSAVPQATPLELPSSPGTAYDDIRARYGILDADQLLYDGFHPPQLTWCLMQPLLA